MNYQPIGGSIGHFIAGLFSRDPKGEMDDDFLTLKNYIEQGQIPHDAAQITGEKANHNAETLRREG